MPESQIDKFYKRLQKKETIVSVNDDENEQELETFLSKPLTEEAPQIVVPEVKSSNNDRLLQLIVRGATIQELKQELGLNSYQLALKLEAMKNNGYLIDKTFSDKIGTKIYLHHNFGKNNKLNNHIQLYTDGGRIRFLVIADTHFGNINDRFDLVEDIYDYAIKNDIRSILHLGDLIDGYNANFDNSAELKMIDPFETAKYVSKSYPKDNNIMNYILLGNHDFRTIASSGLDIAKLISKTRLDMEFLGYNDATIGLYKDSIGLQHPTTIQNHYMFDTEFNQYYLKRIIKPVICLRGHMHDSLFYLYGNMPVISVPSLFNNSDEKPAGAWDITFYFNPHGKIDNIELRPLGVEPKVAPVTKILHKMI